VRSHYGRYRCCKLCLLVGRLHAHVAATPHVRPAMASDERRGQDEASAEDASRPNIGLRHAHELDAGQREDTREHEPEGVDRHMPGVGRRWN
jgi:hypothetical protein